MKMKLVPMIIRVDEKMISRFRVQAKEKSTHDKPLDHQHIFLLI